MFIIKQPNPGPSKSQPVIEERFLRIDMPLHVKFSRYYTHRSWIQLKIFAHMISPYYNHSWPKRNFPFQRQYILKRRDYEKKEMNQLKDILWFNTEFSELTLQEMF